MKIELTGNIKNVVDSIIKSGNHNTTPEVNVMPGSEPGEGYVSETYAISINENNRKPVKLFIKCLPKTIKLELKDIFVNMFHTEYKFYNVIYPALRKLQDEKKIKEPFNNVPNYYITNINNFQPPPILLENLKGLGYVLRDKMKAVDDDHLKLPIKALARYHALSFAMKDQKPEIFQELSTGIVDIFATILKTFGMYEVITENVNQFVNSLDPISDKISLDHTNNLADILKQHLENIADNADDYAVICQGDFWSNNVMFLYDDATGAPIDVKLIDWQCQKLNSPVLDFVHFFYTLTTKEHLDKADYYLNLYYETLSERIKALGSDPNKMYPHEIFREHWRKFALFGLTMGFCLIKLQLFQKQEIPDLFGDPGVTIDTFGKSPLRQNEYIAKIKDLVQYFIDKQLL